MCKGGNFPCYARKLANGRLKSRYLANNNLAPTIGEGTTPYNTSRLIDSLDPFYPRFWEDRTSILPGKSPYTHLKRRGIFVCDMSDLFGIGIPKYWTERVMWTIKQNPMHRFYLLTKQPQNLIKFSPFPDNCWVGVTATNYEGFYFGAIKYLAHMKARVKYISFEPLLEGLGTHIAGWLTACLIDAGINWVIIGAQTKPYKPPKIEWVEEIIRACDKAGIPMFLKKNLKLALPFNEAEWAWPIDKYATSHSTNVVYTGELRQELPDENERDKSPSIF